MQAHQETSSQSISIPAVIVGACAHGLAIARSLVKAGIPVIILESNPSIPGAVSSCARVVFVDDVNGPGLIPALLELARQLGSAKPVLFLTNDRMVRTVAQAMDTLTQAYRISWANCSHDVARLLDKASLQSRCEETGLKYPQTRMLSSSADIPGILDAIPLPVLVKPAAPLSTFKAVVIDTREQLVALEGAHRGSLPFLVQKYIPGDDRAIHFCAFFMDHGQILARFDGHKIRSRPMGHTTIAEAKPNQPVFLETLRFFSGLNFSGPVSLELKDDGNGNLYVIEPTVGRTDFWLGVCTANGVDLPLVEYCQQAGLPLPACAQTDEAVWFHEERDPFGIVWFTLHRELSWDGRRADMLYLGHRDAAPARRMIWASVTTQLARIRHTPRWLMKRVRCLRGKETHSHGLGQQEFRRGISWPNAICDLPSPQRDALGALGDMGPPFSTLEWFQLLYEKGLPHGLEFGYALSTGPSEKPSLSWLPVVFRNVGGNHVVEGLSNYYTPLFLPPVARQSESALGDCLAQMLATHAPETDEVNFRPMDASGPLLAATMRALRAQGFWADTYFCFGNWYLEVAGRDYATYFASLPSEIRKNMPRRQRKLATLGSRLQIVQTPGAELDWAIAAYDDVYRHSWKHPEPFSDFIPGLCRLAATRAWLRLGVLSIGDIPIAAQIWFVKDGTAHIYKLAYKEDYGPLSAGTVLTAELLRHVMDEDKVAVVDYGIGDDPYKADWMSHRRERVGLIAFRKTRLRGILAAARHFGRKLVKKYLPINTHLPEN